ADRGRIAAGVRRARLSYASRRLAARHSPRRRAGRGFVRRHRAADGEPRTENRERKRAYQSGDDADVDLLRSVLLLRALSADGATGHQSFTADGAQRCAARHHSARRDAELASRPNHHPGALGWSVFLAGAALVPLDVERSRIRIWRSLPLSYRPALARI